MFELSPVTFHLIVVAVGLILYALIWRVTAPMPAVSRLLSRLVLSIVFVLPAIFAYFAIFGDAKVQREGAAPPRSAIEDSLARKADDESRRRMRTSSRQEAPKPPPPVAAAPQPETARRSPPPAASPPSPTRTLESIAPPGSSASQPDDRALQGGDRGIAAAPDTRWDVVPVFFGTDRQREDLTKRIGYGTGRARRLELGRALVTVPKSHQVPQVERPWVYKLPFTQIVLFQEKEDPTKHFTMQEVRHLSKEDFLALVRTRLGASKLYKDHAVVFVHGFSVTFDNAIYRTAQIAYDLKFDGAPFLYSWPSNGVVGPQDYTADRESSGQAEPYLKDFLKLVTDETGAKSVSIIAHSMGNQLLLRALRELRQSAPDSLKVSEIILAAPDVDRDTFEFLAKAVRGLPQGITLLAASNDRALAVSRRFWGGTPRAGDVPLDTGPVVLEGIDTIDVTAMSTDLFSLNHATYAERPALLRDMELLIRNRTRPPNARIPELEAKQTSAGGTYWSYRSTP